jgi:hypothetical protein
VGGVECSILFLFLVLQQSHNEKGSNDSVGFTSGLIGFTSGLFEGPNTGLVSGLIIFL